MHSSQNTDPLIYQLTLDQKLSLKKGWRLLENAGLAILYGSEEEESLKFYIELDPKEKLPVFPWIKDSAVVSFDPIDWSEQWALHGHHFYDGQVHIPLGPHTVSLIPGSGFGDFSHPTTRLMLQLLQTTISNHRVIDIGCGSGILSLAAILLGASFAYGLDIDQGAIDHAKQNQLLNKLENQCQFLHSSEFEWSITESSPLILMNMIQSEQIQAWESLKILHNQPAVFLTSGIRKEGVDSYLSLTNSWGWNLKEMLEEEEWVAFIFDNNNFI